jgi:CO/xanthine dehydrogenase FAD-binding subunit
MIVEYFRPKDIKETLDLIKSPEIKTLIMGGGTSIDRYAKEPFAVVDLQDLGLNSTLNLRQVATVAGTLIASGGRSPFSTAMLALDASIALEPGDENIALGDLFLFREEKLETRLVTRISIPLNAQLAYEYIARTPADVPIVCAAVARWPSGRTRVTLGGTGGAPVLAMDGPDGGGEEISAADAYSRAGDEWASSDYRQEMAQLLVKRCLAKLSN